MCTRRGFVASMLTAAVVQRTGRVPRIGFLTGGDDAATPGSSPRLSTTEAFVEELGKLGYVDGRNIVLDIRRTRTNSGDGATYAAALAQNDIDLFVASSLISALELRRADPAKPMVIATCPGMVSNGFAASLDHPGGHVTGIDELPPGVTAKRLTLLKAAAPQVSRVALLSTTPGRGGHEAQVSDAEQAAATLGVRVKPYRAASIGELQSALDALAADGNDGMLCFQGGLSLLNRQLIIDFAAAHRLPVIYQATLFAESGGLMAWAPNLDEQFRIAARYVDRILKGANPGDLPIQYAPGYALTINGGTAKRLGLTLPQPLLAQAARVL